MSDKPVIVLTAKQYDEYASEGLLNDDYIWIRQEAVPDSYEAGIESIAIAMSEAEIEKRAATMQAINARDFLWGGLFVILMIVLSLGFVAFMAMRSAQ